MSFTDPWNALLASEQAIAGIAESWGKNPGQVGTEIGKGIIKGATGSDLPTLEKNLAALAVGLGLFSLGTLMIAFSAFDDLANLAEKALGIANDPIGAAVGNKPLLRGVLTKILP
jgi:hypothetical protein